MACLRTLSACISMSCTRPTSRLKVLQNGRYYSVFPAKYLKPVYKKEDQDALAASGELTVLTHSPIKPAFTNETSSEFHDPIVQKFITYIMRHGKRELARSLLDKAFAKMKMIQIERYNKATPEEKENIELDPRKILHKAIENCTPLLELKKMKRGGSNYLVPVPVVDTRATFLAMNWLVRAAQESDGKTMFYHRLSYELIDASMNQGRVVKRKQELYRQCEANRAYAHFRWA